MSDRQKIHRRDFLKGTAAAGAASAMLGPRVAARAAQKRPSILFCIGDDWGWPHAPLYGDRVVKTPTFDRVAAEGVLFTHAFCASPSCTPSRGAILTGQAIHRLEDGGDLHSILWKKFKVYPDLLWKQPAISSASRARAGDPATLKQGVGRAIPRDPRSSPLKNSWRKRLMRSRSAFGSGARIRTARMKKAQESRPA